MSIIEAFQDVLFPSNLGYSATKTIIRNVEVQNFISGRERRNARKYHSKRNYNIGVSPKSFAELARISDFFEARRGALIGFRWHDILDCKSCSIDAVIDAKDQKIGVYDGINTEFQLIKIYGDHLDEIQNYSRKITKPIADTVLISLNDSLLNSSQFLIDAMTGMVSILPTANLELDDVIYAGFEFNVAVRFADSELRIDYKAFNAGEIVQIPLVEILD